MKSKVLLRAQFVIKLTGAVVVVAYCLSAGPRAFADHWYIALVVVAIEIAAQVLPFAIDHAGARDEFTADAVVVVAAALLLPTQIGALAVVTGFALGYVVTRSLYLSRFDEVNGNAIAAFLVLSAAHYVGAPGITLMSVAGALLAAVLYESMGLMFVAVIVVIGKGAKLWPFVWTGITSTALPFPWLVSLGVLLGIVGSTAPWALPLMAAPMALILLASRARIKATEDRTRLDGLLQATTRILAATTVDTVTAAANASVSALFENQIGRIDFSAPGDGELGVAIPSDKFANKYLIIAARDALISPYTDQDHRLLETLASITASALDKAALHEDVTEQATKDALTGLVNRRSFEDELKRTLVGSRSSDATGVVFLDLDGFKKVNDDHGHQAGDEVLVETARRLLECIRGGDTVARLGGDEFTILLRGVHNKEEAAIVADRVIASLRNPVRLSNGVEVNTTPSLGIALATDGDASELLKNADAAMYEAKRAGKNCWRLAGDPALVAE